MEQKLDKKKRMILIIIAVLILTIGVSHVWQLSSPKLDKI